MLKYFQTTTIILLFCFLFSILWSIISYWCASRELSIRYLFRFIPNLPSLVVAPLLIFFGMSVFGLNLIYPPHFVASIPSIILHAIAPALVLLFASGLFYGINQAMTEEYSAWSSKNFVKLAIASGVSRDRILFKLTVTKVLLESWCKSLPWVIGDLIILESIFNAPGLGLDAWHLAKSRDLVGMMQVIIWLVALYFVISFVTSSLNKKLGRKLEGYV